jgi:hypothetical protein
MGKGREPLSSAVEQPDVRDDHSASSNAEVRNKFSCSSNLPICLQACRGTILTFTFDTVKFAFKKV